ncbi:hypothetical protein GOBAR_AA16765 [Gossypium barbadense]|uniref:Uncharacterized protein n=1 Tax=Gossypium barbadense TaxID=3634 RepID=A0A2P5XKQ3_GOSBA|nr:hypothetical protein GOBAR_AA16765 [Gossypium barbadense]
MYVCFWQGVFEDYKHPFVVSYIGTSLLTLYLPLAFFKDFLLKLLRGLQGPQNPSVQQDDKHRINLKTLPDHVIELGTKEESNDIMESQKNDGMLSAMQVVAFGFCMAPIWFATEYLTNAALARTSVANTTLLSSTSGLFTLIFGAILGQDSINAVNVVSVVISITGDLPSTLGLAPLYTCCPCPRCYVSSCYWWVRSKLTKWFGVIGMGPFVKQVVSQRVLTRSSSGWFAHIAREPSPLCHPNDV